MVVAMGGFAQTSLVATLTHDGDIKMFYGGKALKEAHDAAENGDVINLSGGAFQAVDITKAVAIRGVGVNAANPTIIVNDFGINISSDVTERLSFEGCEIANTISVNRQLINPYFFKCSINAIRTNGNGIEKGLFAICNVYRINVYSNVSVFDIQLVNCHVAYADISSEQQVSLNWDHCVIDANTIPNYLRKCQLKNCIIYNVANNSLPPSSTAINSLCLASGDNPFRNISYQQNCWYEGSESIFQDSDVMKDLTDEAKAKYIGTDGTPIGMYGGLFPYDMTPSYPYITKLNVANKTTEDGKLNVNIEIGKGN